MSPLPASHPCAPAPLTRTALPRPPHPVPRLSSQPGCRRPDRCPPTVGTCLLPYVLTHRGTPRPGPRALATPRLPDAAPAPCRLPHPTRPDPAGLRRPPAQAASTPAATTPATGPITSHGSSPPFDNIAHGIATTANATVEPTTATSQRTAACTTHPRTHPGPAFRTDHADTQSPHPPHKPAIPRHTTPPHKPDGATLSGSRHGASDPSASFGCGIEVGQRRRAPPRTVGPFDIVPGEALAEDTRFELAKGCPQHAFQLCAWQFSGVRRRSLGSSGRVLKELVGKENLAGPTLAGLGTNFGLSTLIGKTLAIISDARLSGNDNSQVVERLLTISGDDTIDIDRKYREPWTGRVPSRLMILSNELPHFGDSSGVIANRFILLSTRLSWLGKEDPTLTERLTAEMPGILNWALDGLARLQHNGRITEPPSSREAITTIRDTASPTSAFIRERCTTGPACTVPVDVLWDVWRTGPRTTASAPATSRSSAATCSPSSPSSPSPGPVAATPASGPIPDSPCERTTTLPSSEHNPPGRGPSRTVLPDLRILRPRKRNHRGPRHKRWSAMVRTLTQQNRRSTGVVRDGPRPTTLWPSLAGAESGTSSSNPPATPATKRPHGFAATALAINCPSADSPWSSSVSRQPEGSPN